MRKYEENGILGINLRLTKGIIMKKKEKAAKNLRQIEQEYMEKVVLLFTVLMVSVFPLYYRNYYSDILTVKYQFCYIMIIAMAVLLLAVKISIYMIGKSQEQQKGIKEKFSWKGLSIPEWMILVFCTVTAISTFTSDYFFESFWGNEGRYSGLFLWLLYGLMFALVSRLLKFKGWLMDIFLFSGAIVCILGILDYFHLDPLNFKVNIFEGHRDIFTSTIGNVNSFSAIALLYSGAAVTMFGMVTKKEKFRTLMYGICTIITFMALYTSRSDNAFLGLAAIFAFLPFCLFRKKEGIVRYFAIIALFLTVGKVLALINTNFPDKVIGMDSISGAISTIPYLGYIVIAMWTGIGIIYWQSRNLSLKGKADLLEGEAHKGFLWAWAATLALALALAAFAMYDINFGNHAEKYGRFGNYLLWNDDWGTHRGFIWRIAIENYSRFSPVHKIFGYGPETFGIITKANNGYEMLNRYEEIYDNAHNGFLQYFITMGPIGLISYLGFLISSAWIMMKKCKTQPHVMAALLAAVGYAGQELVSIDQPVVMPLFLLLISMGNAACRTENMESGNTK